MSMTRSFSGEPSPDHSTLRILNPLGHWHFQGSVVGYLKLPARREAMIKLNDKVLQEFAKSGLSINEGIASGLEGIKNYALCLCDKKSGQRKNIHWAD
jgi:hypothetical protein